MTLTSPTRARTLPVRLTDIPLNVRAHAAQTIARTANPDERADILAAAIAPTDTLYYVRPEAATLLQAWKQAA